MSAALVRFVIASFRWPREMSEAEFTRLLAAGFDQRCAFSRPGSVHFVCIDWRHLRELLAAGKDI
jgi:hypothetical protein